MTVLLERGEDRMATVTTEHERTTAVDTDQCVIMRGIDWNGYTKVLQARGERSVPRMVYLDGDLYLMSPAYRHEGLGVRLSCFVVTVADEFDIPCTPTRHTTFRREEKKGGAEGDDSFYFANEPRIRDEIDLHLRKDPPPDLVVEAVNTHVADAAVEVWRRFGVPEVWVEDGDGLTILSLRPNGDYLEVTSSVAFPFLTGAEIHEWIIRPRSGSETVWRKTLRRWVVETLVPRAKSFPKPDQNT
jgi:Uma2 family endonuclease